MADLSKLSDADLAAVEAGDLSKVSDAGLAILEGAPAQPKQPFSPIREAKQSVMNTGMGALRSAADIGANFLSMIPGTMPKEERKKEFDSFFNQFAQPESVSFKTGQLAGDVAATAGIPGAIAKPFMAGAKYLPALAKVGQAVESAGFAVPKAVTTTEKFVNPALRVMGGALPAGAATAMISPENAGQGAAIGGALGAASPLIGKVTEAVIRRMTSPTAAERITNIDDAIGQVADDLGVSPNEIPVHVAKQIRAEVEQAVGKGKTMNVAAMLRKRDFDALGIDPLLGQITRDPMQYARELNLRGVNPEVMGVINRQTAGMQKLFNDPAQAAIEAQQAGKQLANVLSSSDDIARANVTDLYKAARQSSGLDMEVPLQGFAQDVSKTIKFYGANRIPSPVKSKIAEFGIFKGKQTKLMTMNDAEELIQIINKNYDKKNIAESGALDDIRNAIKKAIVEADTAGGPFDAARKAAKARFDLQDEIPALKAAVENGVEPLQDNFVSKYIIGGKTADVKNLANFYKNSNPQAFEQAKAQMAAELRRAAFGENLVKDTAVRPEMLAKKLRELGTEKMSAFFSPEEINRYQTAARVAAYIEKFPNKAPVNTSNTLVAAIMEGPTTQKALGVVSNVIPGGKVGGKVAEAVVRGAAGAVKNEMAAGQAVKAQIPVEKLDLSPSQKRILLDAMRKTGIATVPAVAAGER